MDKEKQVIEMAKILCPKGTANCEKCSKNYKCDVKFSQLSQLVDGGCQIVGDDEIVITNDEYKKLRSAEYDALTYENEVFKIALKKIEQAKQETAREILQELFDYFKKDVDTLWIKVVELAKKYGIELEDNNE